MMLSPLLLNPPKAEARDLDSSSDGSDEMLRERKGSDSLSLEIRVDVEEVVGDRFRLRLAIFEEGGTGISGTSWVCLLVVGSIDIGRVEMVWFDVCDGFCWDIESWLSDWSSIDELVMASVVISKRLERRRRRLALFRRRKYFCAWLATCVGVLVLTKFLEIPLQSPFPTFFKPTRNSLCSSSVHGTPLLRSRLRLPAAWTASSEAYPSAPTSVAIPEDSTACCSYWERLFILIHFLKLDDDDEFGDEREFSATAVNLTPNSINPPPPPALVVTAGESGQVRALWPLLPHWEQVLGVFKGGAAIV